eukprot:c7753_g1_i1.p2 GENE.c7753_g1_i1~~c7753_g1_i1.p2  ORF type:complete len:125 (-),score=20.44 c7753_g1_i1:82-456(-)
MKSTHRNRCDASASIPSKILQIIGLALAYSARLKNEGVNGSKDLANLPPEAFRKKKDHTNHSVRLQKLQCQARKIREQHSANRVFGVTMARNGLRLITLASECVHQICLLLLLWFALLEVRRES